MVSITFTDNFLFGAGVSDYQHFGGSDCDLPKMKTVDHYSLYKKDFEMIKDLELSAFRTAIEWSRIEPVEGQIDREAVRFYHEYFKELRKTGVKTFVTLHHFTNPPWIHNYGGWTSRKVVGKFLNYVNLVIREFGDYIDHYIVFNEPSGYPVGAYILGRFEPRHKIDFINAARCTLNMAKAQKKSYDIIKSSRPEAKVGFTHAALDTIKNFKNLFASKAVDFFNDKLLGMFSKSSDFIGVNYYFSMKLDWKAFPKQHSVHPESIRKVCNDIFKKHKKPLIITENGIPTGDDSLKSAYLISHLKEVEKCVNEDNIDIQGYIWWTFLHGYEWFSGFDTDFSLVNVDTASLERKTIPTAKIYAGISKNKTLDGLNVDGEVYRSLLEFNKWPSHYYI